MNRYLNPNFVLYPFHQLLETCRNNVLMGLRMVEKLESFPEPTAEELRFLQFAVGKQTTDIANAKEQFKSWVIVNGFEDIYRCFRFTLERLYVYKSIEKTKSENRFPEIDEYQIELERKVSKWNWPTLINEINGLTISPLQFEKHMDSFNAVRNCLTHSGGIVTERRCNNERKDALTLFGNRFKFFFQVGEEEILAEIGKPGPENTALMLGGEEFEIEFRKGDEINLSLKQFLDIMNTCVFVRADIDVKLNELHTTKPKAN